MNQEPAWKSFLIEAPRLHPEITSTTILKLIFYYNRGILARMHYLNPDQCKNETEAEKMVLILNNLQSMHQLIISNINTESVLFKKIKEIGFEKHINCIRFDAQYVVDIEVYYYFLSWLSKKAERQQLNKKITALCIEHSDFYVNPPEMFYGRLYLVWCQIILPPIEFVRSINVGIEPGCEKNMHILLASQSLEELRVNFRRNCPLDDCTVFDNLKLDTCKIKKLKVVFEVILPAEFLTAFMNALYLNRSVKVLKLVMNFSSFLDYLFVLDKLFFHTTLLQLSLKSCKDLHNKSARDTLIDSIRTNLVFFKPNYYSCPERIAHNMQAFRTQNISLQNLIILSVFYVDPIRLKTIPIFFLEKYFEWYMTIEAYIIGKSYPLPVPSTIMAIYNHDMHSGVNNKRTIRPF